MNVPLSPEDTAAAEAEKLAKARRMAKAFSAPPAAPASWATTTEWPGRHKRRGDRRVHATARFFVNDVQRIWTACGKHVGQGSTPLAHMPVDCRACKRAVGSTEQHAAPDMPPGERGERSPGSAVACLQHDRRGAVAPAHRHDQDFYEPSEHLAPAARW